MSALLIVCNVSLLSAQSVRPTFANFRTNIDDPGKGSSATTTTTTKAAPAKKGYYNVKKSYFRLGEKVVALSKEGFSFDQPYVVLCLHNNEFTATEAAKNFVTSQGGMFIELLNDNQKTIEFTLFDKKLEVDPNRIFTPRGRWEDLSQNKKTDVVISRQINQFAQFILNEIPEGKTIVAVHNNPADDYTINEFYKGGDNYKDAKAIYKNPELNPNDFILTTDKNIYDQLKAQKLNVVLQDVRATDDGSLSIFCSRTRRSYVSIETQMGHVSEQEQMLSAVAEILK